MLHFPRSSFCLNIFCDSKPHVMDESLPLLCVLCLSPVSPDTWHSVSSHWHSVSRHLAQCLLTLTVLERVEQLMRRQKLWTRENRCIWNFSRNVNYRMQQNTQNCNKRWLRAWSMVLMMMGVKNSDRKRRLTEHDFLSISERNWGQKIFVSILMMTFTI